MPNIPLRMIVPVVFGLPEHVVLRQFEELEAARKQKRVEQQRRYRDRKRAGLIKPKAVSVEK